MVHIADCTFHVDGKLLYEGFLTEYLKWKMAKKSQKTGLRRFSGIFCMNIFKNPVYLQYWINIWL